MSDVASRTTVDIGQIAKIANVGRSAVGNWRKRHSDFPVRDPSGRFDLQEIEQWLIENGKIDTRIPAEVTLWPLADSLRNFLDSAEMTQLLVSLLVYLEACDASTHPHLHGTADVTIADSDRWERVRSTPAEQLGEKLHAAATRIEQANPSLDDLLAIGLEEAASLQGDLLASLIESLQAAIEDTPRIELLEEAINRASKSNRFRGQFSTPDGIAELMVRLGHPRVETVCDLACGEGGLLLKAADHLNQLGSQEVNLIGLDISRAALRVARSRCFIRDVVASLHRGDVLRTPVEDLPGADLILLDLPLGQKDWGDSDTFVDQRWIFGIPPRNSSELAWIQLAVQCLAEDGRAIVSGSANATLRGKREMKIREAMLEEGVIKAVIQLPRRLRTETSVPLAIWVLQSPQPDVDAVLLIDASNLGKTRRSEHDLGPNDIDRIVQAVHAFEAGRVEDKEIALLVGVNELIDNDAILDPKRYQPPPKVDFEDVRNRSQDLRTKLPNTAKGTTAAIGQLMDLPERTADLDAAITCSLGEVADFYQGTAETKLIDSDDGIPFFGISEISAGGRDRPRFVEHKAAGTEPVTLRNGDVVVAIVGDVGKSALVSRRHEGAVLSNRCALIRSNSSEVTGGWIHAWAQSNHFRGQISRSATGGALPTLGKRALANLIIPIPTPEKRQDAEQLLAQFEEALEKVGRLRTELTELRALDVELLFAHDGGTE